MEWELKVVSSVVGVPALSRRASARATERKVFIAKGPAQTQAATRRGIRTPDDMVLWRLGAAAATSAGHRKRQAARHQIAMLNGIVARAKQEHPRGEGSNGMNSVVGILMLDSSWALLSYMCKVACESALDKLSKLLARKWETN